MKMSPFVLVGAALFAGFSSASFARGGSSHSNAGGMSATHMSSQGLANTNGPAAADRDKGLQRAEDRQSAQGSAHQQATRHAGKKNKAQ